MRAIIQRVNSSKVVVDDIEISKIDKGILVFTGFNVDDTISDLIYMYNKIINLRIFEDDNKKMNLSVLDTNKELLIVSQFTLYGDCRKGNRPSFVESASANIARDLYDKFIELFNNDNINIKTGIFQADMKVFLENDGPVTIQLDSKKLY